MPSQVLKKVFDEAAQLSGIPVIFRASDSLQTQANLKMARNGELAHIIQYHTKYAMQKEYLGTFQAGFILRAFGANQSNRFEVGSTPSGRDEGQKLVSEHFQRLGVNLPDNKLRHFASAIYDGLGVQIRSVPVGLRIDSWILTNYPELKEQQKAIIHSQLEENIKPLSAEIRKTTPKKHYDASLTINAAFASFWAKAWGLQPLEAPYALAGFTSKSKLLIKAFHETMLDADHDKELLQKWIDILGVKSWYKLTEYK